VIAVPRNAPATGTIAEKIAVLREACLPMHLEEPVPVYSEFEVDQISRPGDFQSSAHAGPQSHGRAIDLQRLTEARKSSFATA